LKIILGSVIEPYLKFMHMMYASRDWGIVTGLPIGICIPSTCEAKEIEALINRGNKAT